MKLKYLSLYKSLIYIVIILLIFQVNLYTLLLAEILTIIAFFAYLTQKKPQKINKKWVYSYILFEFLLFLFQVIRVNSISIKLSFLYYGDILLLLLVFPIYEVLKIDSKSFLKNLNLIGIVALILRATVWVTYNFLHYNIGFYQWGGGREDWARVLGPFLLYRSNGLFIDGFLFAYSLSKIFNRTLKVKNKLGFYLEMLFLFLFSYVIYQSRTQLIYYIVTVLVGIIYINFHQRSRSLNLILTAIVVMLIVYAFKDSIVGFVNSFSQNSDTGGSTSVRILEYQYFPQLWKKTSLLLGFGYIDTEDILYAGYRLYLTDLGILAQLYQNGILGFIICIFPFVKGLIVLIKNWNQTYDFYNSVLILFFLYLIVSSSNFNPYVFVYFPVMPLFIAMVMTKE